MGTILSATKRLVFCIFIYFFAIFASYMQPIDLSFIAIRGHFLGCAGRITHGPHTPPPSREEKNSRWMASWRLRQFVRGGAFHLRDTLKFMFTLVSSSHDYLPSTCTQESLCESFIWHEDGKEKKRWRRWCESALGHQEAEESQSVGQATLPLCLQEGREQINNRRLSSFVAVLTRQSGAHPLALHYTSELLAGVSQIHSNTSEHCLG